ncbi:hypothetical protein QTP88_003803 [Uroleucon formosanum]
MNFPYVGTTKKLHRKIKVSVDHLMRRRFVSISLSVVSIGLPIEEISSLKSEEDIECILKSNEDEKAEENVSCTSDLEIVTSDLGELGKKNVMV